MHPEAFMEEAFAIARTAKASEGTAPFGAVVVKNGEIVGRGLNRARACFDPTSHGETEAIRDACRNLRTTDLSGCDLYTSCEPCALCVCAMTMAGISRMFYAASLADAPVVFANVPAKYRNRVPSDVLRREAGLPSSERAMPAHQVSHQEGLAVLKSWAEDAEKLG